MLADKQRPDRSRISNPQTPVFDLDGEMVAPNQPGYPGRIGSRPKGNLHDSLRLLEQDIKRGFGSMKDRSMNQRFIEHKVEQLTIGRLPTPPLLPQGMTIRYKRNPSQIRRNGCKSMMDMDHGENLEDADSFPTSWSSKTEPPPFQRTLLKKSRP
jgi:hypothetical protein